MTPAPMSEGELYVPGEFCCAKCGFTLSQFSLSASTGAVGERDEPGEKCPNDGSPLWRVTWKQRALEHGERASAEITRVRQLEAELLALRAPRKEPGAVYADDYPVVALAERLYDLVTRDTPSRSAAVDRIIGAISHLYASQNGGREARDTPDPRALMAARKAARALFVKVQDRHNLSPLDAAVDAAILAYFDALRAQPHVEGKPE